MALVSRKPLPISHPTHIWAAADPLPDRIAHLFRGRDFVLASLRSMHPIGSGLPNARAAFPPRLSYEDIRRAANLSDILSEQEASDRQREALAKMFHTIKLSQAWIRFEVKANDIVDALLGDISSSNIDVDHAEKCPDDIIAIELPINLRRRGNGMRIVIDSPYIQPEPDRSLVDLIARAHLYLDRMTGAEAMSVGSIASAFNVDRADVGRILPLAFLSPKMLDAILTGTQPASLSARHLARIELSMLWAEQNAALQQIIADSVVAMLVVPSRCSCTAKSHRKPSAHDRTVISASITTAST